MIRELSNRIWTHNEFHEETEQLLTYHLRRSLRLESQNDSMEPKALHRLLQSASHLSASADTSHRDVAFRIAAACLRCFASDYTGIKAITSVILGRLGNFPARDFMQQEDLAEQNHIPLRVWLENAAHESTNSVTVSPNVQLTLTDFQISLWNDLHSAKCVVVSAPTSSGKSFALQNSLIHQFFTGTARFCVYLVPTRALITQVSESLIAYANAAGVADIDILTVPIFDEDAAKSFKKTLYVLTQERFQILLDSNPNLQVDIVVVDEAQMIGDDSRGVILHTVIDRILRVNPNAHVHFGSPNTKNPEIFPRLFQLASPIVVQSRESPVVQNLIVLRTDAVFRDRITASLILHGTEKIIGGVNMTAEMAGPELTLARISSHFGRGSPSLVYANGPAECEYLAELLISISREDDNVVAIAPECAEFAQFLRDHFHKEYILADAIAAGIAFHYGNMPAVIRKGIETLFESGKLAFLVCTSTLLQGVNLPARNLFISNPHKGSDRVTKKGKPISSSDFWNLAGRAGRLKKDFEGNVFLIDLHRWETNPTVGDRVYAVSSAFESHLTNQSDPLLSYITNPATASGVTEGFENTFVKLYNDYKRGQLVATMARVPAAPSQLSALLTAALQSIAQVVTLPVEVTERNTNISVYRQQEMLDYLVKKIRDNDLVATIPLHPLSPPKDVSQNLRRIFKRIHNIFEKRPKENNAHNYYCGLAVDWMRGHSFHEIIARAYENKKKKAKRGTPNVSTVIRGVFEDIEKDLRFRYVKYMRCYIDVLKVALEITGHPEYIAQIPSIPLYLELGACSDTIVSLIALGFTRTSAVELGRHAPRLNLSSAEATRWLKTNNWGSASVPWITRHELTTLGYKL